MTLFFVKSFKFHKLHQLLRLYQRLMLQIKVAFSTFHINLHHFFLFQSRSESMASVYSADGGRYGTVNVKGEVEFGLVYNLHTGSLELMIKQCKDLAAVDTKRNRSDP